MHIVLIHNPTGVAQILSNLLSLAPTKQESNARAPPLLPLPLLLCLPPSSPMYAYDNLPCQRGLSKQRPLSKKSGWVAAGVVIRRRRLLLYCCYRRPLQRRRRRSFQWQRQLFSARPVRQVSWQDFRAPKTFKIAQNRRRRRRPATTRRPPHPSSRFFS